MEKWRGFYIDGDNDHYCVLSPDGNLIMDGFSNVKDARDYINRVFFNEYPLYDTTTDSC